MDNGMRTIINDIKLYEIMHPFYQPKTFLYENIILKPEKRFIPFGFSNY